MTNQYAFLRGYFDKQLKLVLKIYDEIIHVDVSIYEMRFLFALKTQQLYTALEDLFKQIAKAFENHIENLEAFHKELLIRMNTDIQKIRPAVISTESLLLLDKVRSFRHFIRHAYDCELNPIELKLIQSKLSSEFSFVLKDLEQFRQYIEGI